MVINSCRVPIALLNVECAQKTADATAKGGLGMEHTSQCGKILYNTMKFFNSHTIYRVFTFICSPQQYFELKFVSYCDNR